MNKKYIEAKVSDKILESHKFNSIYCFLKSFITNNNITDNYNNYKNEFMNSTLIDDVFDYSFCNPNSKEKNKTDKNFEKKCNAFKGMIFNKNKHSIDSISTNLFNKIYEHISNLEMVFYFVVEELKLLSMCCKKSKYNQPKYYSSDFEFDNNPDILPKESPTQLLNNKFFSLLENKNNLFLKFFYDQYNFDEKNSKKVKNFYLSKEDVSNSNIKNKKSYFSNLFSKKSKEDKKSLEEIKQEQEKLYEKKRDTILNMNINENIYITFYTLLSMLSEYICNVVKNEGSYSISNNDVFYSMQLMEKCSRKYEQNKSLYFKNIDDNNELLHLDDNSKIIAIKAITILEMFFETIDDIKTKTKERIERLQFEELNNVFNYSREIFLMQYSDVADLILNGDNNSSTKVSSTASSSLSASSASSSTLSASSSTSPESTSTTNTLNDEEYSLNEYLNKLLDNNDAIQSIESIQDIFISLMKNKLPLEKIINDFNNWYDNTSNRRNAEVDISNDDFNTNFTIIENSGDGNCLFYSLNHFYNKISNDFIRQMIAKYYEYFIKHKMSEKYDVKSYEQEIQLAINDEGENDTLTDGTKIEHHENIKNDGVYASFYDIKIFAYLANVCIAVFTKNEINNNETNIQFINLDAYDSRIENSIGLFFSGDRKAGHFRAVVSKNIVTGGGNFEHSNRHSLSNNKFMLNNLKIKNYDNENIFVHKGGVITPTNKPKQIKNNLSKIDIEKKLILLHYIITDKFNQLHINETDENKTIRIKLYNDIYKKLDGQKIENEKLIENGRLLFNRNINRNLLESYLKNDIFNKYLDSIEYRN